MDGIVFHGVFLGVGDDLVAVDDGGAAGLAVLLGYLVQLIHDDPAQTAAARQRIGQIRHGLFKLLHIGKPLEDIFAV